MEIVRQIITSKNKITLGFPRTGNSNNLICFGKGELSDVLSFGFSYVEQEDHFVNYLLVSPEMAKKIIREVDDFYLTSDTPYIGMLWTAQVMVTDKVNKSHIMFSNADQSVVLDLNTNNMEE